MIANIAKSFFPESKIIQNQAARSMHNPTNSTPHDGSQTTFHIRPRVCLSEGSDANIQSLRKVTGSLSTPQPAYFAKGTPLASQTIEIDFFPWMNWKIPPKRTYYDLPPKPWHLCQLELGISF